MRVLSAVQPQRKVQFAQSECSVYTLGVFVILALGSAIESTVMRIYYYMKYLFKLALRERVRRVAGTAVSEVKSPHISHN